MMMSYPGKVQAGWYSFGFQGQEQDPEIKGTGNSYDFGARMYDPRVGKWMSRDPYRELYPELSPYQFAANNPNLFIDPDGRKIVINYRDDNGNRETYTYGSGKPIPDNKFAKKAIMSLDILSTANSIEDKFNYLVNTKQHTIDVRRGFTSLIEDDWGVYAHQGVHENDDGEKYVAGPNVTWNPRVRLAGDGNKGNLPPWGQFMA